MTNLMPQKIVDKNGVLTTRNVRVAPRTSANKAAIPAPKVGGSTKRKPKRKAPSPSQLKVRHHSYTASLERKDADLVNHLDIDTGLGVYRFQASEHKLYELMSQMDTGNALALLQAGSYMTGDDPVAYLEENGFDHLLKDREYVLEAEERRIPIEDFMREARNLTAEDFEDPLVMDSIETSSITALGGNYVYEVRRGYIKLSDIKAVGAGRIKNSDSWKVIGQALTELASGEANYTVEHLKERVTRCGKVTNNLESSLYLTRKYGEDLSNEISFPSSLISISEWLDEVGEPIESHPAILKYTEDIYRANMLVYYAEPLDISPEVVLRLYKADISPTDYADRVVTLDQLDAIENQGISKSVSQGWL